MFKSIKHELDIWQQHRHPYILPLIGVYLYQGIPCAVSPWCDRGTLLQYIKSARDGHEPELDAPVTDCEFDLLRLHCLEMKVVCVRLNVALSALKPLQLSEVAAGLAHRKAIMFPYQLTLMSCSSQPQHGSRRYQGCKCSLNLFHGI